MRPVLVLYATREGQCRKIAEHAAARLSRKELPVRLVDAAQLPPGFSLTEFRGALLVAPVHAGFHPREVLEFVIAERAVLQRMPARFLSVSLSQAGVELPESSDAQRAQASKDVQHLIEMLCKQTGFPPAQVTPVAGALAYSKYGFLKRLMMRHIAKQSGGSTDTSRDHVYTDFAKLDQLLDDFASPLLAAVQDTAQV